MYLKTKLSIVDIKYKYKICKPAKIYVLLLKLLINENSPSAT